MRNNVIFLGYQGVGLEWNEIRGEAHAGCRCFVDIGFRWFLLCNATLDIAGNGCKDLNVAAMRDRVARKIQAKERSLARTDKQQDWSFRVTRHAAVISCKI